MGHDSFTMDALYFMAFIVSSYSSLFKFSFLFIFFPTKLLDYSVIKKQTIIVSPGLKRNFTMWSPKIKFIVFSRGMAPSTSATAAVRRRHDTK